MSASDQVGRIVVASSSDVLTARQRMRDAAARLGFDRFDQVQLATGISEIGRDIVATGGGELQFRITPTQPRRLVVTARGIAGDGTVAAGPGVVAARRLIGPPLDGGADRGVCTFSRVLPKSGAAIEVSGAFSEGTADLYSEVDRQDAELIRLLEELRQREVEIESINRELEETNRGVLALYAELDDKAESVRQISNERARFLSNVTHELRTPLSSITALCRLLLTERDAALGEEQARQIGYIHKSAQDLLDFVSDLLDLAKVEAGKVAVRAVRFEVDDLLTALRGMFRPLSTDANVPLVFDLSPVPTVETDENKVTQILRNLISNALKFTERGEIRISAHHDADRDEVVFVVADTGIGIAVADLDRIFDEFVQVDTRRGRRERSSGLGLPLSRKLAQLMGGSITVESEVGRGSTFQVRLPRIYSERIDVLAPGSRDGYILVVDDDPISRYVAKEHLERVGWRVIEARDGDMALKLAREGGCRAIVLDLVMPGMSGFDVLRHLGDLPETAAIPVVVRTSLSASEIEPQSVSRAAAVFSKSDDSIQSLIDFLTGDLAGASRPAGE